MSQTKLYLHVLNTSLFRYIINSISKETKNNVPSWASSLAEVLNEVIDSMWPPHGPGGNQRLDLGNQRLFTPHPPSVECMPQTFWDHWDPVHDWTQLRPLYKLLRFWWVGVGDTHFATTQDKPLKEGLSCLVACGSMWTRDQAHWQADSSPLDHCGSSKTTFLTRGVAYLLLCVPRVFCIFLLLDFSQPV